MKQTDPSWFTGMPWMPRSPPQVLLGQEKTGERSGALPGALPGEVLQGPSGVWAGGGCCCSSDRLGGGAFPLQAPGLPLPPLLLSVPFQDRPYLPVGLQPPASTLCVSVSNGNGGGGVEMGGDAVGWGAGGGDFQAKGMGPQFGWSLCVPYPGVAKAGSWRGHSLWFASQNGKSFSEGWFSGGVEGEKGGGGWCHIGSWQLRRQRLVLETGLAPGVGGPRLILLRGVLSLLPFSLQGRRWAASSCSTSPARAPTSL